MSVATQTVVPRPYRFPALLAKAPLSIAGIQRRPPEAGSAFSRDFAQDLDDLSDEEVELEELLGTIRNHGFSSIVPIGRRTTREEQKIAAASDSETDDDDDDDASSESASIHELEELGSDDINEQEEEAMDMDAEMEDLDLVYFAEEDLSDEDMSS
ncbi:hypothetical protein BDZ89DRAFT_1071998 [Hymenopellis radicata]|nr:hypothetical protein BDZ89DRAFT_1071998 [Hymenopellis radicata]